MSIDVDIAGVSPSNSGLGDKTSTDVRNILGVDVCVATRDQAFDGIQDIIEEGGHQKLAFLNAHGANIAFRDAAYRSALTQFKVLADGIGVDLGAQLLYGSKFPANLNGTDFVPGLLRYMTKPRTIGLLGAANGVADDAARAFSKATPHHRFVVLDNGFFDAAGEQRILRQLEGLRPDILLVALGNPKQEQWIADKCEARHVAVPIGVGALFDFVAGRVPRAPAWMISARIEWLYRLCLEPSRMWRRYILGNPIFLMRILRQKFSKRAG